ncbi:hypothetical protein NQ317_010253 [Molorchus minor]|uniref:Uncharacterized protein n=1 Tax=Molorchus minor TaxID=1323400 RepID=A0ABQ9IUQ9_9CUCU|nr:hypothetical protein NQ317_010253 [Molorchus minor]
MEGRTALRSLRREVVLVWFTEEEVALASKSLKHQDVTDSRPPTATHKNDKLELVLQLLMSAN